MQPTDLTIIRLTNKLCYFYVIILDMIFQCQLILRLFSTFILRSIKNIYITKKIKNTCTYDFNW